MLRTSESIASRVIGTGPSRACTCAAFRTFEESSHLTYFAGVIELPEGRFQIGDADGFVTIDDLVPHLRVCLSGDFDPDTGATLVRIDLAP